MKNIRLWSLVVFTFYLLTSCQTSKQLTYFRDLSDTAALQTITSVKAPPLTIQPDDQLQLTISSPSASASSFFNLLAATPSSQLTAQQGTQPAQSFINVYTVSPEGVITLPVLGDFQVAGNTLAEVKEKVIQSLAPYLTRPIVSIRLTNFHVTVIGEVNKPFTVPVNGEKINVLEAIGAAGDMTMYGARNKVKVIRKLPDGTTQIARMDFNNSSTFQSPYFNLRQNDVVYIQPNKKKNFLANNTTFWASVVLSVASIIAVIVTRN
ncbi:MAG: hypothetical protein DI535_21220 [Citrobacter freundii]|nr:MAG: hypothetical protein DI535_21220 [Citrobacter freundii]